MPADWLPVPGAPGYEINRNGTVRRADTGYVMARNQGRYCVVTVNGRARALKVAAVAAELFGRDAAVTEPQQPAPAKASLEVESAPVMHAPQDPAQVASHLEVPPDDEWRATERLPGYEINRSGAVRHAATGAAVAARSREHMLYVTVTADRHVRSANVNVLLAEAFGKGAAEAAGLQAPHMPRTLAVREALSRKRAMPRGSRACHDCGKPTDQYRCEACWRKLRGFGFGESGSRAQDPE